MTFRQVSLQPTQSSQHNQTARVESGRGRHVPAPKGEGRRASDRTPSRHQCVTSQEQGRQPKDWSQTFSREGEVRGRADRGLFIKLFLDEQILAENHLSLMLMPTAESGLRSWSSVFRDVVFILGPGAEAAWFIEAFCL